MAGGAVTRVQVVKGSDAGAAVRYDLSAEQRAGQACLVCGGTEQVTTQVGWINGETPARVHSWHLEDWRLGGPLRQRPTPTHFVFAHHSDTRRPPGPPEDHRDVRRRDSANQIKRGPQPAPPAKPSCTVAGM